MEERQGTCFPLHSPNRLSGIGHSHFSSLTSVSSTTNSLTSSIFYPTHHHNTSKDQPDILREVLAIKSIKFNVESSIQYNNNPENEDIKLSINSNTSANNDDGSSNNSEKSNNNKSTCTCLCSSQVKSPIKLKKIKMKRNKRRGKKDRLSKFCIAQ